MTGRYILLAQTFPVDLVVHQNHRRGGRSMRLTSSRVGRRVTAEGSHFRLIGLEGCARFAQYLRVPRCRFPPPCSHPVRWISPPASPKIAPCFWSRRPDYDFDLTV